MRAATILEGDQDLPNVQSVFDTVRKLSVRLHNKLELCDPDYIHLFLTYFPLFDGCFLLQTSDDIPLAPVATARKGQLASKLEAIPEEYETTDAEAESRNESKTVSKPQSKQTSKTSTTSSIVSLNSSALSYTTHNLPDPSPLPAASYFDFPSDSKYSCNSISQQQINLAKKFKSSGDFSFPTLGVARAANVRTFEEPEPSCLTCKVDIYEPEERSTRQAESEAGCEDSDILNSLAQMQQRNKLKVSSKLLKIR